MRTVKHFTLNFIRTIIVITNFIFIFTCRLRNLTKNTIPAIALKCPPTCKHLLHKDVNICLLLQKREISLRSFCGGERTHCYRGGTGVRCTAMVNTMAYLWDLGKKCQSYLGLGIGGKECDCEVVGIGDGLQRYNVWVIVLGVCENVTRPCLFDFTNITCVSEGTGSSATTKWSNK